MRRATKRIQPLPAEAAALPEPLLACDETTTEVDLVDLFGAERPLEIDIGFGKGRYLLSEAAAHPDVSFLGIEHNKHCLGLVRYRALREKLGNVRLISHDAADVFARLLPTAAADQVHIMFPDPWPKRRHFPRRLIQTEFVASLARVIKPGGFLNVITDHEDYWTHMERTIIHELLEPLAEFRLGEIGERTHFGARFTTLGVPIYSRSWKRAE